MTDLILSIELTPQEKLAKVLKELAELESSLDKYAPQLSAIDEGISLANKSEAAIRKEFEERMEQVLNSRREFLTNKSNLESKLASTKRQLRLLEQEKMQLLQLEAASKQLELLEQKLAELIKDCVSWEKTRPYQRDDIYYMLGAYESGLSGVLNALDMSLGKTCEAAIFDEIVCKLTQQKFNRPARVLWLTKKSLIKTTFKEIQKWQPGRLVVTFDNNPNPETRKTLVDIAVANNAMLLVNYDALGTTSSILDVDWDFIYMDEVHKLKGGSACTCSSSMGHNPGSTSCRATNLWKQAWKAVHKQRLNREAGTSPGFLVPLSGSPIQNHPREMWSYLHLFDPERFPTVRQFERTYCYGWGEYGFKVDFEALIKAMKHQVIRRKKTDTDVEVTLPSLEFEDRYLEHNEDQREVYTAVAEKFFYELEAGSDSGAMLTITAIIAKLTRLRQINVWPGSVVVQDKNGKEKRISAGSAKIDEAFDIIEELTVAQGEQVVVFSAQFNEPLFELERRVSEIQINGHKAVCKTLTGDNSNKTSELQEAFQQKEIDVLLINMATGAEGLNLHKDPSSWPGGATYSIMLDLWYNPETNNQARDRIWRPGQDQQPVVVYRLFLENSVDQFITAILDKKSEMIEGTTDSESMKRTGKEWKELLKEMIL